MPYALYLPPQASWRNRYGEEFTFDDLTLAILGRSLTSESCRGIHLMFALTNILMADREVSILSRQVRVELEAYLVRRISQAVESQFVDGSWPPAWSADGFDDRSRESITPKPTRSLQMTTTGHLLELFHLLPDEMKPPVTTVKSGVLWLVGQLRSASREQISEDFCPYTHAIRALELAIPQELKEQRVLLEGKGVRRPQ